MPTFKNDFFGRVGTAKKCFNQYLYSKKGHMESVFKLGMQSARYAVSLQEANKPQPADEVWTICRDTASVSDSGTIKFVLNGGSLLQRNPWRRNETFEAISCKYVDYIKRKYSNATIAFDGYGGGPSTENAAHPRRTKGVVGPKVN